MSHNLPRSLVVSILPALAVGVLYELFLGHRHDYVGHFAAGYGGTLGATMVWLRSLSAERFVRWGVASIVPLCLACILLGAGLEATAFRLAKFDEIDFCNQSLGAVLAGIAAVAYTGGAKPANLVLDAGLITGIAFLGIGACYAVA